MHNSFFKQLQANWEDDLRWWYIVGFANGMVNGEGYGGQELMAMITKTDSLHEPNLFSVYSIYES